MIAWLLLAAALPAATAPHPKPYWIKTYSFSPYQETWTGELEVKKLDAAFPAVVAAVEKNDGKLTQPLTIFVGSISEKQLSLTVPRKKAKSLLAALRKLGKSPEPHVRPNGGAIRIDEVREKLALLTKEKNDNPVAFAQIPVVAGAVDEMIEHLANVEAVARSAEGVVLLNLTVREVR
jgi:hypothetical protein